MAINFKGSHYPKSVILHTVLFYVRYAVSYRDLEEIMVERGLVIRKSTTTAIRVQTSPWTDTELDPNRLALRSPI